MSPGGLNGGHIMFGGLAFGGLLLASTNTYSIDAGAVGVLDTFGENTTIFTMPQSMSSVCASHIQCRMSPSAPAQMYVPGFLPHCDLSQALS